MVRYLTILSIVLASVVSGQTIYVTDQNIFDLVPDRDAISGLAGSQRIRANFWLNNAYDDPLDVSAALPIRLTVKSNVDDFQITVLNNATSAPPNTVWWTIPALSAGSYHLTANAVFPDDTFEVFSRFLTLTNLSTAPIINITNEVGSVTVTNNLEFNTVVTNVIDVSVSGVTVTNSFSPINNITNDISVSAPVSLTTTNIFSPVNNLTNNISADVTISNIIQSTLIINVEGNTVAEIQQP
jgi:hypothetical protein